jgi:hypothetical protein
VTRLPTGSARVTLAAVALLAFAGIAGAGSVASGDVGGACGPATAATIAAVDRMVATNIYRSELAGSETQTDLHHVTTAPDLLSAVAADDRVATAKAVERIVYHGYWHIVRLRALDAAGRVLADFGGPYVIAPVTGVLRSGTRVIGSFVMSVQDDAGYTKLERHALGYPIGIYVAGRLVVELGARFPAAAPPAAGVKLDGVQYGTVALTLSAFPSGTLSAVIALPRPPPAAAAQPCAAVSVAEIGRVAERIAARFNPLAASYAGYVQATHADTGAFVVVRIGLRAIAGSQGPGPPTLPLSGSVSYLGKNWSVFSFAPTPPARIYLLIPQG